MDIEKRLLSTALEEIKAQKLQIASGCEDYLTEFIKQGASNLQNRNYLALSGMDDGFPTTQTEESFAIQVAEDNLIRFINQMIGYAFSQDETVLREDIFCSIRDKICPLFPFC